jgi:hypothetical protein
MDVPTPNQLIENDFQIDEEKGKAIAKDASKWILKKD